LGIRRFACPSCETPVKTEVFPARDWRRLFAKGRDDDGGTVPDCGSPRRRRTGFRRRAGNYRPVSTSFPVARDSLHL
jgi:hypothetical protein